MGLRRDKRGVGKTPNRVASVLCMVGIGCATWELGRLMGSNEAARMVAVASTKHEGIGVGRAVRVGETQQNVPRGTSTFLAGEEDGNRAVTEENRPAAAELIPAAEEETVPAEEEKDRLHPDRFWKAYAADRYSLLTRGVLAGEGEGGERGGAPATVGSSRVRPTKYLVFANTVHGLGNHMAGMMSAFALSIATERVFLHDWVEARGQVAARYDEIFVQPFEPWAISAATGSPVSGPDGLLGAAGDGGGNNSGGGAGRSILGEEESVVPGGRSWVKPPEISSAKESERCLLELTPGGGVKQGFFNKVFINKRGEDPMPDCPVIFVFTNQFLVEMVSSPAYGSSKVGGTLISEWLAAGRASQTLFPGLFRPVAAVRQRIADESARLYPTDGPIMAAHARSFHLGTVARNNKFVGCLGQLARSNNVSTILLATDMGKFPEFAASKLGPSGVKVVTMDGVERSGEGKKMRNTLEKIQMALTEMMLVGEADFVVTSPRSSYSALAAARGGSSTQRYGGISCERQVNDPEFHSLECAKNEWGVDQVPNPAEWAKVYPFVDSNRKRCKG